MAPALAQDNANQASGIVSDWTHQHVIFANPGTVEEAQRNGTFDTWERVINDPRFRLQQLKRNPVLQPKAATSDGFLVAPEENSLDAESSSPDLGNVGTQPPRKRRPQGDWSYWLGTTAGAGVAASMYPATFGFSTNGSPTCSDYAVYALNKAGVSGATGQPSIIAFDNLYSGAALPASASGVFTTTPADGDTFTITNGANQIILSAAATWTKILIPGGFITTAIAAETGGTSGMVVDNVSTASQASSLYFGTLGATTCSTTGGGNVTACAVKRTQSGLQ
jgi:hypothetical protein